MLMVGMVEEAHSNHLLRDAELLTAMVMMLLGMSADNNKLR